MENSARAQGPRSASPGDRLPRPDIPRISCLCVTAKRPAFLPWLLWNYDKQEVPSRELVIVESSQNRTIPSRTDIRFVHCSPGASVAQQRNAALSAARGSVITWFDDDDWQHPHKAGLLLEAIEGSAAVLAGATSSWFVELATGRARPYERGAGMIFNTCGVHRTALAGISFDERLHRAADTPWLKAVTARAGPRTVRLARPLAFWLCHRGNLSNPAHRYVFTRHLEDVRAAVGADSWGETDSQLDALRRRIAGGGC